MKTLVVCYSTTGNTMQIAEEVASALNADIEILKDPRIKPGLLGYLRLAHDTKSSRTRDSRRAYRAICAWPMTRYGR